MSLAIIGCTVAEQSPHQHKVKGLNPITGDCSGNESGEKSQVHNYYEELATCLVDLNVVLRLIEKMQNMETTPLTTSESTH
jgi:hypothetical protein